MVQLTVNDLLPGGVGHSWPPPGRRPGARDYAVFFLALPLLFALWATAIGMAPARMVSFDWAFLYIATQVSAAWWANALGSHLAARLAAGRQLPHALVLVAGFLIIWIPLGLFFKGHSALFQQLLPALATAMDKPAASWTLEYVLRFIRYSLPFLPIWIVAVYGYQVLGGVRWFAPVQPDPGAQAPPSPAPVAGPAPASPAFLATSRLPPGATVWAMKAEEHYLRIWSDGGTDLIRYRFRDAVQELAGQDGAQVHRSWWIHWDRVEGCRTRGRSMELNLPGGLLVPVSLSHKAEAARRSRGVSRPARDPAA